MNVCVTGGGGFVGGAVARLLAARGDHVVSFSRGAHPELAAAGIQHRRGDLASPGELTAALREPPDGPGTGWDAVIHTAAKAGAWGPAAAYRRANVDGTREVLAACRALGVPRLVFTSSPSVVHAGGDLAGVDESLPHPDRFPAAYPATKAEAERMVLAANGPGLATTALRPHLVWGPGDPHLVPRIVARARQGRLALVGDGSNLMDATYIDNAADAHVLALDRLVDHRAAPAGRAYFVANDEPIPLRRLMDGILDAAGLGPVTRRVPLPLARAAGTVGEAWVRLRGGDREPLMTRFLAEQLATAHWFDLSAARRDLGYVPRVGTAEGLRRLRDALASGPPG